MKRTYGSGGLIQKKGCRNWVATFWVNGKQLQRSTETDKKHLAEEKLRQFLGNAAIGNAPASRKLKYEDIREGMISEYRTERRSSLVERKAEDGTVTYSINMGLPHLDSFFTGMPVAKITSATLRIFVSQCQSDTKLKPSSINRCLAMLKRMFRLAVKDGKFSESQVPKNWPFNSDYEQHNARKGFVDDAQFNKLLAELPTKLHPLVIFLYWTGARIGEAKSIQWHQVDLDAGMVRLEDDQTKNEEPRLLPLADEVVAALRPLQKAEGFVFDQSEFRKTWKHACERAGIPALTIHDLRRSAIRNLRKARVSEGVIMKISGHKTRSVFERYNIVDEADVQQAMLQRQEHKRELSSASVNTLSLTFGTPSRLLLANG